MGLLGLVAVAASACGCLAITRGTSRGSAMAIQALSARNATKQLDVCGPKAHLFASSADAAYFWANKNRDATCTGAAPYEAPSTLAVGPSWSWKDATASIVSVHPCIDAERNIYLSNRNGVVRKFSRDGQLLWENKEAFAGQGSQVLVGGGVISDGSIYVGTTAGEVLSVSMQSGRTNWKVKATASTGPDSWSLMAHNGMVLTVGRTPGFLSVPDFGGNELVVALDARNGTQLWTFKPLNLVYNFIGSFVDGPPSVVFADWSGRPYRVALCDGALLWRNDQAPGDSMTTGGAIVEPSSGRVFAVANRQVNGSTHGAIRAYSVASGALLWQRAVGGMPTNNAPAVGRLRRGSDRLSVVVAAGDNPFPKGSWDQLQLDQAERTGFWSDGTPIAWGSKIFALDAATGAPTGWEFTPETYRKPFASGDSVANLCLPDSWSNAAIGGDGSVYVGHMSGRIFALHDADGDGVLSADKGEVTSYFGGRCYQGSPGLAPGMLVATPCDGLHVFNA